LGGRIPEATLKALLDDARQLTVAPHAIVFSRGDPADAFYFVRAGALEVVSADDTVVARLGPGDGFGEAGLREEGTARRSATVRTMGAAWLLRIDAARFRADAAPSVFADGGADIALDEHVTVLADLAEADESIGVRRTFEAGARVIVQGEHGEAAYFVLQGYAHAFDETVEPRTSLGNVGPGQCFGELALLDDSARAATVEADTELTVLEVPRARFLEWHERHPPLRELLSTMRASYVSAESGSTTIFAGKHDGEPCVTSIVRTPDGHAYVASKLVDRPLLVMSTEHSEVGATETIFFDRSGEGRRRTLTLTDGKPIRVVLEGELAGASELADRMRRAERLDDRERTRFRWTGLTGRPRPGADRLVCGCVGLTRGEVREMVDEGLDLEAIVAKTSAGSLCGSCDRSLHQTCSGVSLEPEQEVSADELELQLEGLAFCADPNEGLFGRDSVSWQLLGESSAILGGGAAILMQLALPAVAEGLATHSTIADDPSGRFERTMSSMYRLTYGPRDEVLAMAREIHDKHATVVGRFQTACGKHGRGESYAANQVESLLWVAMTLTYTLVVVHEDVWGPLSEADKDRLVDEARAQYTLFGIPKARVPDTWAKFVARFDEFVASDRIVVGDAAKRLSSVGLQAPKPYLAPAYAMTRPLTIRWLPEPLREGFGLRYGRPERFAAEATLRVLRRLLPTLPQAVRLSPPLLNARRRLEGKPGRHPVGSVMRQLSIYLAGGPLIAGNQ